MALPTDPAGRPLLNRPLTELLDALATASPAEFEAFDAPRVLLVGGAARRAATASIRPLTYGGTPPTRVAGRYLKPSITIDGVAMRYEICLRPKFFLALDAAARVHVLAHEMWHVALAFDGTLAPERRHAEGSDSSRVDRIVDRWREAGEVGVDAVRHEGEARILAWTERPPSRIPRNATMRDTYDESDLHSAIVEMR